MITRAQAKKLSATASPASRTSSATVRAQTLAAEVEHLKRIRDIDRATREAEAERTIAEAEYRAQVAAIEADEGRSHRSSLAASVNEWLDATVPHYQNGAPDLPNTHGQASALDAPSQAEAEGAPVAASFFDAGHSSRHIELVDPLVKNTASAPATGRLAVITFSIFTVALGIILSFVPWLDYIIFRELKLWNGSLSYSYWQRPGVTRLTKVYIFNVTNPQGFLENGEKPKLVEVGPFVYREDMEKVNIKFHDNDTVTFQHNKILRFVPEMSVDKNQKLVVPNIPLLTVTSFSPNLAGWLFNLLVSGLAITYKDRAKPFVQVTAEQLVFGYDDPLVTLAHYFYPKGKRPNSQMGLLLARNGTLDEVETIYTGQKSMDRFGYIDKINGMDHLPHWKDRPCNDIRASEGSFFPPRAVTKSDIVHVYDKDLCRILPLQYRKDVYKDGIQTGLYTPPSYTFESADVNEDNKCYCQGEKCPPRGLQNISPCQYNAPVYLSYPHFYDAEPSLLEGFEGLNPQKKKHETYFMIQPKLGVPIEGFVRVQLNLKVDRAADIHINNINRFPDTIFPVMWVEEGIHEVTTPIWRWIYLATTVGPVAGPFLTYSMIVFGLSILVVVFVRAYKSFVIGQNSLEIVEYGRETLRRGSTLIIHGSHKILTGKEATYQPLHTSQEFKTEKTDSKVQELKFVKTDLSQSLDELKSKLKPEFVRTNFSEAERETLIHAENSFILSEHGRYNFFQLPETYC